MGNNSIILLQVEQEDTMLIQQSAVMWLTTHPLLEINKQ